MWRELAVLVIGLAPCGCIGATGEAGADDAGPGAVSDDAGASSGSLCPGRVYSANGNTYILLDDGGLLVHVDGGDTVTEVLGPCSRYIPDVSAVIPCYEKVDGGGYVFSGCK